MAEDVREDPKPSKQDMQILQTAARDVRVLVSYLSRSYGDKFQSLQFDASAADKIQEGEYSKEIEHDLWQQLSKLSDAAFPASAESILESKYYKIIFGKDAPEDTSRTSVLTAIRLISVAAFFVAFVLGVYTAVSATALSELASDLNERDQIILHHYDKTRVETSFGTASTSVKATGSSEASSSSAADASSSAAPTNSTASSAPLTDTDAAPLALDQVEAEIEGGYSLLGLAQFASGQSIRIGEYTAQDGNDYTIFNRVVLDVQDNINQTINNYIIPMIASFLGVAVFIIRDTAIRLESVSLSPMDTDGYWPRIILGLIAGLTIGWLTPSVPTVAGADGQGLLASSAAAALSSLSKTAIAFVVGYSIEVLFNILDAIKAALGVKVEK
jgi:hypothetical protein